MALEPSFAWPHINRGLALARAGRFEEARRSYERALRLNNRFAEAWVNLALVDLELNDLSGAENALDRAVALGRKEATVYLALAEVKARRGDREAASRLFDRLIAERPNEAAIYTARGLFRVSQDPRGAESDLTRALEYDSAQARAHYGLALLYRKTDLPRALKHAEAALATDPNLVDALQARALLRARLGLPGTVDDVDALVRTPSPYVLYNTACALAIYSQVTHQPRFNERALELLGRSIRAGFPVSRAQADPDLEPLRTLPGFAQALGTGTPDPRAL
ncbi:MAG: tetratricopeptide repeat protein [Isosphaeraceae bacterium]